LSTIEIESTVTKMKIGKTEKDKREESSGLSTQLSFEVVGSPRALARMANLLKQGNTNISLIIKATNAATDVEVKTLDLPHQMGLGEQPVPPVRTEDLTANAGFPPVEEKAEPGTTPIRTGEPITTILNGEPDIPSLSEEEIKAAADKECEEAELRSREAESNAMFDDLKSAGNGSNGDKPGVVLFDLNTQFEIKVPDGDGPYTITLDGCRKKSKNLVSGILTVFNSKAIKADTAEMLIDALLLYPQSENRDMLLEVLRVGHMPEKQPA
jgi:hypothetical protein